MHKHTHIYIHIYTNIYIYIFICMWRGSRSFWSVHMYIYINNYKYIQPHFHTQLTHTYAYKTIFTYLLMHIHNCTTLPYTYMAISSKPPKNKNRHKSIWNSIEMNHHPWCIFIAIWNMSFRKKITWHQCIASYPQKKLTSPLKVKQRPVWRLHPPLWQPSYEQSSSWSPPPQKIEQSVCV